MLGEQPFPTLTGEGAKRLAAAEARIVVVGAGGWLGLATLEALNGLLGDDFGKRVVCFGASARALALRGGLSVDQQSLERLVELPPMPTLLLHLAFLTQERAKAMSTEEYTAANESISGQVLAALDTIGAEAVFLPSSGATYLVDKAEAESSMRIYGRLKLADEQRFAGWAESRGKRVVIARVFNLSGPYINKQSSYALACFIADALAQRPIVIRAVRPVVRSYVAIHELMSVVFGLMTQPGSGFVRFDTAGDRDYEMAQIAEVVREVLCHGAGVDRAALSDQAPDRYVGDGAIYRAHRRRLAVTALDFSGQVRETARYMAGGLATIQGIPPAVSTIAT